MISLPLIDNMNSPLGKYSAITAAFAGIGIITAYILAIVFQSTLKIDSGQLENLKLLAFLAGGAIFGAATAVNGTKASLNAIHTRLDAAGIAPAASNITSTDNANGTTTTSSTGPTP